MKSWITAMSRLLLVGCLAALAACGGPSTPPGATAPTQASEAAAATSATVEQAPTSAAGPAPATAVAPSPATAGETRGGPKVLRVAGAGGLRYPATLDPQQSNDGSEIGVLGQAYEGLTRLDNSSRPVPAAAESWTFNSTGDVLTFTLRAGLTYSDGSPLTSENFRFAIERTCDPKTAADYQSILFEIAGCEAFASASITDTVAYEAGKNALAQGVQTPDAQTLVLRLTNPAPHFLYIAGLWVMYPVKQEVIARGDDWWATAANHIGNGPFQIADIQPDQLITLKPNPHYWGGQPKLDGLEYVYPEDPAVTLDAYQAGQIDVMRAAPGQLPAIRGDAALSAQLAPYPSARTFQLQFNLNKAPFDDEHVRKAFAYAVDRLTYCERIRNGACRATLSWIPEGVPGHIRTDKYAFDPEKARAELAASRYGSADKVPPITFTYNSDNPMEQPVMEWFAGQFRDILGITIKLDPLEGQAYRALLRDNATFPQLTVGAWTQDYPDPQNWLSVYWLSTAAPARQRGFKHAEFDALVRQADKELDPARREQLYQQAGEILVDTQAGINLANPVTFFLVKPGITGYEPTTSDALWPGQWASPLTIDINR